MEFKFSLEGGYYLELSTCMIALVMLVYTLTLKTRRRIQSRIFLFMLIDTAVCAGVSFVRNEMELHFAPTGEVPMLQNILLYVYYIVHNIMTPLFIPLSSTVCRSAPTAASISCSSRRSPSPSSLS